MIITDPEILVVDDSVTDRLLMSTVFGRAGFVQPLQFACDGEEAIAYLRGAGEFGDRGQYPLPTVMLLDLNMPRKDGFEVLAWVRQQPAFRGLRIYVLSASSQPEDIQRCSALGANVYLVKPRNLDGLKHLAATLLAWIRLDHLAGLDGSEANGRASWPLWTLPVPPTSLLFPLPANPHDHRRTPLHSANDGH